MSIQSYLEKLQFPLTPADHQAFKLKPGHSSSYLRMDKAYIVNRKLKEGLTLAEKFNLPKIKEILCIPQNANLEQFLRNAYSKSEAENVQYWEGKCDQLSAGSSDPTISSILRDYYFQQTNDFTESELRELVTAFYPSESFHAYGNRATAFSQHRQTDDLYYRILDNIGFNFFSPNAFHQSLVYHLRNREYPIINLSYRGDVWNQTIYEMSSDTTCLYPNNNPKDMSRIPFPCFVDYDPLLFRIDNNLSEATVYEQISQEKLAQGKHKKISHFMEPVHKSDNQKFTTMNNIDNLLICIFQNGIFDANENINFPGTIIDQKLLSRSSQKDTFLTDQELLKLLPSSKVTQGNAEEIIQKLIKNRNDIFNELKKQNAIKFKENLDIYEITTTIKYIEELDYNTKLFYKDDKGECVGLSELSEYKKSNKVMIESTYHPLKCVPYKTKKYSYIVINDQKDKKTYSKWIDTISPSTTDPFEVEKPGFIWISKKFTKNFIDKNTLCEKNKDLPALIKQFHNMEAKEREKDIAQINGYYRKIITILFENLQYLLLSGNSGPTIYS